MPKAKNKLNGDGSGKKITSESKNLNQGKGAKTNKVFTSLIHSDNAKHNKDLLKTLGIPFTFTCSNYSSEIRSEVFNRKFVSSFQSVMCFAAFQKIKTDVTKHKLPRINKNELVYFLHDFKNECKYETVYNI